MKTIDLATDPRDLAELLGLAATEALVVRTADGKVFTITKLPAAGEPDDFAEEVALTRQNESLRALLDERSKETGTLSLEDIRSDLGLTHPD